MTKSSFVELEPIDVAIEEMTKKVNTIRTIVVRKRTDMKMLQMQLQGSLSLQVNAGPMEYASVFLKKKSGLPVDKVDVRLASSVHRMTSGKGLTDLPRPPADCCLANFASS